ncbi:hypothetical protein CEXT_585641 [Caerostris extrusa]|uniref:Uncharacterized protein n=1 Tax=Caerostris extrusa TaxID=172846 RepID=A0AAV4Y4W2_CAEEX|nr:hypothetical protein CEXT_585641 [Caerostris extrusa]
MPRVLSWPVMDFLSGSMRISLEANVVQETHTRLCCTGGWEDAKGLGLVSRHHHLPSIFPQRRFPIDSDLKPKHSSSQTPQKLADGKYLPEQSLRSIKGKTF